MIDGIVSGRLLFRPKTDEDAARFALPDSQDDSLRIRNGRDEDEGFKRGFDCIRQAGDGGTGRIQSRQFPDGMRYRLSSSRAVFRRDGNRIENNRPIHTERLPKEPAEE